MAKKTTGFSRYSHLIAGCAFAALLSCAVVTPVIAQGLSQNSVDFEANVVTYDRNQSTIVAEGDVRLEHEGYVLIADQVTYNQDTGEVHAVGQVQISDPNGNILILDEAELDRTLSEGFIRNIRLILSDGSRLVASEGAREAGGRSSLDFVTYTPCPVCEDTPDSEPVWKLRAVRVVHDDEAQRLYYENAVLDIMGFPVLFLPYLSHPDPRVERASGILAPEVRGSRGLGLSIALPYHHVFSQSADLTLIPIVNASANPILAAEYRQHLGWGQYQITGSGTYTRERDINNLFTGRSEFRGHLFSDGVVNHSSTWRTSYLLQGATDDTYLRRYGFAEQDSLMNEIKTEAFFDRSYLRLRAVGFQGLRVEDVQGLSALALPMFDYNYVGRPDSLGGTSKIDLNALALVRVDGADTRRLSGSASWNRPYQNDLGQIFDIKAAVRADVYKNTNMANMDNPNFAGTDGTYGRVLPYASASFSWPFVQLGADHHQIVEPIVNVVAAPNRTPSPDIANEDSRTFELSDSNIFSDQRFPGIDRWEGGSRVNYGVRWQFESKVISTDLVVAQSYRIEAQPNLFGVGSGIDENFSDYVGRLKVEAFGLANMEYSFRLDKDTLDVRRHEINTELGNDDNRVRIGYFKQNRGSQFIGLADREEIQASATFVVKDNWTVFGDITRNLTSGDDPIAHTLGVMYRDDCLELSLAWQKFFTFDRDIESGSSIMFRISFRNLG